MSGCCKKHAFGRPTAKIIDHYNERQIKVLNRLLDTQGEELELGISASRYQALAKVSKATATRELSNLVNKNCICKLPGGGRSTRYAINSLANKYVNPE